MTFRHSSRHKKKEGSALFFYLKFLKRYKFTNYVLFLLNLIFVVSKRFYRDHCFDIAGSLTYTTLLALVPLFAVSLSILHLFPAFNHLVAEMNEIVSKHLLPSGTDLVQKYIKEFSDNTNKLTLIGSVGLFITSLLTLWEVDLALSMIWRTHKRRQTISMLLVYWALLTIGPLLFGMGLVATSSFYELLRSYILSKDFPLFLGSGLLILISIAFEMLAFFLVFWLVPKVPVKYKHAMVGAGVSAVLFEVAKFGLGFYLIQFKTYQLIYGAFSFLPTLLVWLFIVWSILLFGAELTACLGGNCHKILHNDLAASRSLWLASRIVGHLAITQSRGEILNLYQLDEKEPLFNYSQIETMLHRLEEFGVVRSGEKDEWILIRDVYDFTLGDLFQMGGFDLDPNGAHGTEEGWDQWLGKHIGSAHQKTADAMKGAFADMLGMRIHH